jgi:hypothetical protein
LNRRQQHGDQHRDDGDYHQELAQCKAMATFYGTLP